MGLLFLFQWTRFVLLKRILSITLLLALILRSSELDQLVRIPALISHYLEHSGKDGSMSFERFLELHYQSENGHLDDGDHKDLPFKSHDCQSFSQILVFETFVPVISAVIPNWIVQSSAYCDDFYFLENLSKIWQPPQAAVFTV